MEILLWEGVKKKMLWMRNDSQHLLQLPPFKDEENAVKRN